MIAVALALIGLVVMIATGVAASSTTGDHLTFLGVGVQTTTAQVFLTGAIFGWVFVIALWLLRLGIHKSGERCAQLAARRSRRASQWLGFGDSETNTDEWSGWDDWGAVRRRAGTGSDGRGGQASSDPAGALAEGISLGVSAPLDPNEAWPDETMGETGAADQVRGTRRGSLWLRAAAPLDLDGALSDGIMGPAGHGCGSQAASSGFTKASPFDPGDALSNGIAQGCGSQTHGGFGEAGALSPEGVLPGGGFSGGVVGGAGAAGYGRGAPWRVDGGGDQAGWAVAGAVEQAGVVGGGYSAGPVAGDLAGGGVGGGAEGGEVGGGSGSVAGEDRGAEGEDRAGEGCQ
nr:hypothetical protein [Catenulispora acidiphila]